MNNKLQRLKYISFDFFSATIAWIIFFIIRKTTIDIGQFNDINFVFSDSNLYKGIIFIPLFWLSIYTIQGTYKEPYKKSRLKELEQTFWASFLGIVAIFFILLLDDHVGTFHNYYLSFLILFIIHFSLTYIPRVTITTITVRKIHSKRIGFPTIIIGSHDKALKLYHDMESQEIPSGNKFIGFIEYKTKNNNNNLSDFLSYLGDYSDIKNIIEANNIEEIIIALDNEEESEIHDIITEIETFSDVLIKIPADKKDILLGRVKMSAIFQTPLVLVSTQLLSSWQKVIKRTIDISFSIFAIILLLPIYIITGAIVYFTSKGPIFYKQERIGFKGKPFYIYKFRSMYINAESGTPMLSSTNDKRITPFGKFMRKTRLDEIPQFYNVLIGNMSLVGPRPERQFFIDQIVKKAPEYRLLHNVKPGITSWGQVKFGYAENVEEMIERLQYDLIYIENMSIATDIKILLYTFIIIFQGRGK